MPHIRALQKLKQEKAGKEVVNLVTYIDTLLDLEIFEGVGKLEEADVLSLSSEFINTGVDTTTTMFQWVMAYLVKHPRIQAKLFVEISRIVEQGAEEVKEEDLQRIPDNKNHTCGIFRQGRRNPLRGRLHCKIRKLCWGPLQTFSLKRKQKNSISTRKENEENYMSHSSQKDIIISVI
jgi:hypothetical protein